MSCKDSYRTSLGDAWYYGTERGIVRSIDWYPTSRYDALGFRLVSKT